ncbi:MAG: arginine repressor [Muribaculaceae bacterium]|nr:arginine repressor [Muribaculaceae bacterium]MBQ4138732.1 arginine repressor [Muribaculaceae bacterium]
MKNKRNRLQLIMNLIKTNNISSQNELAQMLRNYGINVTQATLSRDLKSLKVTKIASDNGEYIYIIPDSNELQDSLLIRGLNSVSPNQQVGFVSIKFSGNIAVIKTRNGYATGLAYDLDMSKSPLIVGTIAGADTVFIILNEGVSRDEAINFFSRFVPIE